MARTSLPYRLVARAAAGLVPLAAPFHEKVARSDRGRRGATARLAAWGARARDPARPLVWLHAPSVGEGLQAESVLAALRRRHPEWQYAYTWFSPSAEPLGRRLPVDIADYLPWDLPGEVAPILAALRPTVLAFAKLDLWPELATRAAAAGTRVAMVAGTVAAGSGRLRWPARALLRPGYASLSAAGAISADDAKRLVELGAPADRVRVTGDPRFDSVVAKVGAIPPDDPLLRHGTGAPALVAGSTWPGDEQVILDAFARLHVHRPDARLILVPHEPTEAHLVPLERRAVALGLPAPVRLSRAGTGAVPILLVDRVGVLAALYGAGRAAYVGGGFGRSGLHSVLEPAAWGVPVVFGPRWQNSRDAGLLLEAGGAESLSELGVEEAGEALHALWDEWLRNEARRAAQGQAAREVVERGRGAAEASAALLEELVARAT